MRAGFGSGVMASPVISVVVIFLDAVPFLGEAIASVEAQTWLRWELILVDDGSTDGSSVVAREAAARDPERIRYVTHQGGRNCGMSASRNLGIEVAEGEYVAFLDGDDVWHPKRLERHIELLQTRGDCVLVAGPTEMWFSWAEGSGNPSQEYMGREDSIRSLGLPDGPADPPGYLIDVLEERAKTPAICSFTARTQAVRDVGGFDDDFRGMFEDQVFFSKMLLNGRAWITTEVLDRYRQHPGSACYVARLEGHYHGSPGNPDQRAFVERLEDYLARQGEVPPALERAMARWRRRLRHPWRAMVGDAARDPRRSLRMSLRFIASKMLPERIYRRVWARAQGFDPRHDAARDSRSVD